MHYELSDREKTILRYVIHQFILTASPVGSRNISKRYNLGLSPASIRNIMADLEETGFLGHPHISAGRVPTDQGYRFYVDTLMKPPRLNKSEIEFISANINREPDGTDELIQLTAGILSEITHQIALVTYPKFENAFLQKIQLVLISSSRLLVVLSIKSGFVKTITLEVETKINKKRLSEIEKLLNERLSGLSLKEIRDTFKERLKDKFSGEYKPIIRLFIDSAEKIFTDDKKSDKAVLSGTKNILAQPEFEDHENVESISELIEDKDIIIHVMDKNSAKSDGDFIVTIGRENKNEKLKDYSLITKEYTVGDISGILGIVGPKRMQYSKAIASIIYLAELLSQSLKK